MLLVSVLNSIPVFVVGNPGSSKSLAVSILQANLKGRASSNDFLRSFPAVALFFHQCSPQSTSQGILQVRVAGATFVALAESPKERGGGGGYLNRLLPLLGDGYILSTTRN